MKNFLTTIRGNRVQSIAVTTIGLVTAAVLMSSPANAALSAAAEPAFTALKTDALSLIDLAWTIAAPVSGGFLVLGLFKKAAAKGV